MRRTLFTDEQDSYRESFRRFLAEEVSPHYDGVGACGDRAARDLREGCGAWLRRDGRARALRRRRHRRLPLQRRRSARRRRSRSVVGFGLGLTLHNDICLPYLLSYATEEQRERWLPGVARGELILAIAMTEPETGSDLAGIRTTRDRAPATTTSSTGRRRSSPTASTPTW